MFVGRPEWKFVEDNASTVLTREGFISLKEKRLIQEVLRTESSRDEIRPENYCDG